LAFAHGFKKQVVAVFANRFPPLVGEFPLQAPGLWRGGGDEDEDDDAACGLFAVKAIKMSSKMPVGSTAAK